MQYYRIYGLDLETDLDFPYLQEITPEQCSEDRVKMIKKDMPAHVVATGDGGYEIGEHYSFLHNRTVMFEAKDGKELTYQLKENGNPEYMKGFLLGYGLTMICLQRKRITMHCSAVAKNGQAVLICGKSGSGKSTLTANLLERNFSFLADDIAAVITNEEKAFVYPSFPYQKLCRDAVLKKRYAPDSLIYIDEDKDKFLVSLQHCYVSEAVPLKAIVYLYPYEGTQMQHRVLKGLDAFGCIVTNQFLRNLLQEDAFLPYIGERCLKIASKVEVHVMGRPLQGEAGDKMADFVEKLVTA